MQIWRARRKRLCLFVVSEFPTATTKITYAKNGNKYRFFLAARLAYRGGLWARAISRARKKRGAQLPALMERARDFHKGNPSAWEDLNQTRPRAASHKLRRSARGSKKIAA